MTFLFQTIYHCCMGRLIKSGIIVSCSSTNVSFADAEDSIIVGPLGYGDADCWSDVTCQCHRWKIPPIIFQTQDWWPNPVPVFVKWKMDRVWAGSIALICHSIDVNGSGFRVCNPGPRLRKLKVGSTMNGKETKIPRIQDSQNLGGPPSYQAWILRSTVWIAEIMSPHLYRMKDPIINSP